MQTTDEKSISFMKYLMKNKKLLISAGVCLLLIISEIVAAFANGGSRYIAYLFRITSFLCVIGTFVFNGLGMCRRAIACATFCIVDAFIRYKIDLWPIFLYTIPYWRMDSDILQILFELVTRVIPDVFLMVYVLSKRCTRNAWVVIGIVLTLLGICNDYIYGIVFGRRVAILLGIPFGLVYLFGFMDRTQAKNKEKKKTTTSYLEQYKQEHGMK